MKLQRIFSTFTIVALLGFGLAAQSCKSSKPLTVSPSDSRICYSGRINFNNPEKPLFVFPATQIAVNFEGKGISMKAKPGSGHFMVSLDDKEAYKIVFTENDSIIRLAENLSKGKHSLKVMLAIEGYEKRPEFHGFVIDGGKLLDKPAAPKKKVEFIGNSITCGYGSEANSQKIHYSYDNSNHYYTYAAILARELDFEEMCVARSGIGVYRNYNGKFPGENMTKWYDYTCIYDSTQVWDFNRFRPDVICVNLGTNDLSTKGYDINTYKDSYRAFIKHLAAVQPQAKIAMLSSQMLTSKARQTQIETLKALYDELKGEGLNVYFLELDTQDPKLGYGADWHPSKAQHRQTAEQLKPFLKQLLED